MLTIRLRRIGKRQHATFRFIVSEKTRSPQSRVVEFLGSYDPHTNPPTVNLKRERVSHWLQHGAQPSETVHNILVDAGLLQEPKVKVGRPKKKPEADKPSEAAVKPAAEVPKEEPKIEAAATAPAAPEKKEPEKRTEATPTKAAA